jgi:hypothetical protein
VFGLTLEFRNKHVSETTISETDYRYAPHDEELVIAEGTVRRHVSNTYNKIGAINRSEATRYALRAGLVELDEMLSTTGHEGTNSGQH